jgi:hypothetical protein
VWHNIKLITVGGQEILFHTSNECRDMEESLFERVMAFLKSEDLHV